MRTAEIQRTTTETDIRLSLNIGGTGKSQVATGCGFLDHMLELFARHSRFDLAVEAKGDTWVDDHHTVEDVAICLGDALGAAMGDLRGVTRYGSTLLPMDEALVLTAIDLSGRSLLCCELDLRTEKVGTFDTQLVEEFLLTLTRRANFTLHVRQLSGVNSHHIIEAVFKSLARSLRAAVAIDPAAAGEIPSTKGVL